MSASPTGVVVLASGGTDSAVLLHWLADEGREVHPLYLRQGAPWEEAEIAALRRFLDATRRPELRDLTILDSPLTDLYDAHEFGRDGPAPLAGTPDDDVYMPGRNLTLLARAGTLAAIRGLGAVALAPLDLNPFPDGTPAFFSAMSRALSEGLGRPIEIVTPFREWRKRDVVVRGRDLPLELTLSCAQPVGERHCGRCSKCYERHTGFLDAGVADPTDYAEPPRRLV
jgi:7-cyano-7-deazaguanine synthase